MNGTVENGSNSFPQKSLTTHRKSQELRIMKNQCLFSLLVIFAVTACKHEVKIMEETYPDGSPKRECVYIGKDASRELIRETTWYPHNKIQMTGEFKSEKRDGRWIYYYENGNVWSEGFFKNGKSDGKRTTHYENGRIFYEGYYQEDRRMGVWKFYDEKGALVKSVDYSKESQKSQTPDL
jgi:antitoxin component YwqK of YwqJK toxin-antitoxin module